MFDQPVQLEVFPTDHHLRRIDPACNMRCFYRLSVQRDLFGGACLIREWGRIGYRGQVMIETHDDETGRSQTQTGLCPPFCDCAARGAKTEATIAPGPWSASAMPCFDSHSS